MSTIPKRSLVSGDNYRVQIDPYETNPIASDYAQVNEANFRTSWQHAGEPPKMFDGGRSDLPATTASGIDPQLLLRLPYTARHAAADLTDPAQVHALFQQAEGNPDLTIDHPGLHEAIGRMRAWASGRADINPEGAA